MRRVAVAAAQIRPRFQDLVERAARPREVKDQLVRRKRMIDRIAQGGDDAAIRNVRLNPAGRERMEKVRADFSDLALARSITKMTRVPIDTLVVEGVEELGFLDAIGQLDDALEHPM